MNTKKILNRIQQLPFETRYRILWISGIAAAAILIGIWIVSLKAEINRLDSSEFIPSLGQIRHEQKYVKAEWTEISANKLLVYFKVTNNTNDILNFAQTDNIKLQVKDREIAAENLTDRQNRPFVKKILSKTENYGILIFPRIDADEGNLLVDQMYFEMKPDQAISEKLELNFKDLNQALQLRK